MKARRSMTIAETVKHFPGAHMKPDGSGMRPEPLARDEWYAGYAAALASIWRNHHAGQDVRHALLNDGITIEHLRDAGVEKYDLDAIREALSRS
jgi:hypothetical protein